jgi:hypothetical protein
MHHFANPPSQEIARYPRYRFYGIALSKRAVFEAGGSSIYLTAKQTGFRQKKNGGMSDLNTAR